jgi:glutamate racemase
VAAADLTVPYVAEGAAASSGRPAAAAGAVSAGAALAAAGNKRVLVFATKLTLQLEKFRNLVERVDADNRVDYLPLQELVQFAERFEFSDELILPYLYAQLAEIDLTQYGAVVLGCTHFPFFRKQFEAVLPPDVQIVDGNVGTINNLMTRLGKGTDSSQSGVRYFISGKEVDFEPIRSVLKLRT